MPVVAASVDVRDVSVNFDSLQRTRGMVSRFADVFIAQACAGERSRLAAFPVSSAS
jgi:hypothetical protein